MFLKEQLAEYRAGWVKRVPAERQAVMERHINELQNGLAKTALQAGDRSPPIVLTNAKGSLRGLIVGIYATCISATFGVGAAVIGWVGIEGYLPFAIGATSA